METIDIILNSMSGVTKVRKKFLIHVFILFLSIRGRVNFMNMSRIGKYSEKSYRLHFEKPFDFFTFNKMLVEQHFSGHRVIAGDCSYISKSGKKTPDIGMFWNGCASKSCRGLEISSLAVVDIENNTAMHIECKQTPGILKDEESRIDFYLHQVVERKDELKQLADYIVNDGAYAKKKYVDGIVEQTDLHLISKMRKDADLRYLYRGPQKEGKGRPKTYDGKMNCKKIDKSRFDLCYFDDEVIVSSAIVNSKSLKRNIRITYVESRKTDAYAILFSTDTQINGHLIYRYYKARFQIEFLFRDAKQHTGLSHCQARSENKLYFHFNTSLTSVSLAKAEVILEESGKMRPFSMANVKTIHYNRLLLDRFFAMSEIDQTCPKIYAAYNKLLNFGRIAA